MPIFLDKNKNFLKVSKICLAKLVLAFLVLIVTGSLISVSQNKWYKQLVTWGGGNAWAAESQSQNTTESNSDLIEKKQETLESLEQKARNYQRLIDLKKKQQDTLKNQLELMDVQLDSLQNSIQITEKKNKSQSGSCQ